MLMSDKNDNNVLDAMFYSTKHKKSIPEYLSIWIINIIGVTCILTMIVFAYKLISNQSNLRVLCDTILNQNASIAEVEKIADYIGTLHTMITAIDYNAILALVYSILSTLCLGVGLFFLKTVYSRQKEMKIQTVEMGRYIELCELINHYNATCVSIYNYAILLNLSIHSKNTDVVNETYCRLRDTVKDCDKQLNFIINSYTSIPTTSTTTLRIDTLGYAQQSFNALKDETDLAQDNKNEIDAFIKTIDSIINTSLSYTKKSK